MSSLKTFKLFYSLHVVLADMLKASFKCMHMKPCRETPPEDTRKGAPEGSVMNNIINCILQKPSHAFMFSPLGPISSSINPVTHYTAEHTAEISPHLLVKIFSEVCLMVSLLHFPMLERVADSRLNLG